MTLLLIICSLIQVYILPGLLITVSTTKLKAIDKVIVAIPLSFLLNHLIVIILVTLNLFNHLSLLSCFLIEIILLLVLNRKFSHSNSSERFYIKKYDLKSLFNSFYISFLPVVILALFQLEEIDFYTYWDRYRSRKN